MELCTKTQYVKNKIPNNEFKECFTEYKLQDQVDALKNYFGIRDGSGVVFNDGPIKEERKKLDTTGVKECLQPSVPSTFQALVTELRDTVRNSYWNKEIGKTIYLPPHLPAGCDPIETTFGKATKRDAYGVAEIVNPRDTQIEDCNIHRLYRKSHNDYYPSEQTERNYVRPFDKFSSFGDAEKRADFSGKRVANCLRWFNTDFMSRVSRRQADFENRTESRLGNVKNSERSRALADFTFGKNSDFEAEGVADVLKETIESNSHMYCSDYAEKFSNVCGSSRVVKNIVAGVPSERSDLPYAVVPDGAPRCDKENLGDQTSVRALISPSLFTQMGLSHVDFFKIREYEEIRSIFENIGVEFPDDSFDILWSEGLKKDCTGGVCVETFRNLLGRLAMNNYLRY